MTQKILITGKNGQLGAELQDLESQFPQYEMVFLNRDQMDLSQPEKIQKILDSVQPSIIINAGAYTAVDKAEIEAELTNKINHLAVKEIGVWAADHQAKVIHISTDYVFDGRSQIPLKEDDNAAPINVYGFTKLKGELALQQSGAAFVVVRTAWVYSTYGSNFVKTMLRLMNEREEISVVNDQIGAPTYARDLAEVIMQIIQSDSYVSGVYHYTNKGKISWYDFAVAIKNIKGFSTKINAVSSEAFQTVAKRPKFSLLDTAKIEKTYQINIPYWEDSLKEMLLKVDEL